MGRNRCFLVVELLKFIYVIIGETNPLRRFPSRRNGFVELDANVSTSYNEATIRACRLVRHAVSLRGVSYSREVARFALFGGRLPKVKVLTADVPINVICVVLWVGRVFLRLQNKKR